MCHRPGYAAATVKRLACATVEPGIQAKPSECDLQGTICVKDERVDKYVCFSVHVKQLV